LSNKRINSYRERSRDWPDDTRQPAIDALVPNPAGYFLADEKKNILMYSLFSSLEKSFLF
jgi:hypothetical protein